MWSKIFYYFTFPLHFFHPFQSDIEGDNLVTESLPGEFRDKPDDQDLSSIMMCDQQAAQGFKGS